VLLALLLLLLLLLPSVKLAGALKAPDAYSNT
jgi:hypothetical protein